jgi:hypothetical protein
MAPGRRSSCFRLCVTLRPLLPCNDFRAQVDALPERMEEQATRLELCLSRREVSTYVVSL